MDIPKQMKQILVLGAGLSSPALIRYLLDQSVENNWQITVADAGIQQAEEKIKGHPQATATAFDVQNREQLLQLAAHADLVISLLPATMHILVARVCLQLNKHLITASYITAEMKSMHVQALKQGLLFLNECGLDPGIDHMSAMQMIHSIQKEGGTIDAFKSYCGGLVAPEFDTNPWHYKFTWNPRNVVLAGQGTARYLYQHHLKFIPPSRIFTQTESVQIHNGEIFEAYANRDSLEYIQPYGISSAHTVMRGTLRVPGFCSAWNALVQLGLTDDSFAIHHNNNLTWRAMVEAFTPGSSSVPVEERIADFLRINLRGDIMEKLRWLGLFEDAIIPMNEASPAAILQQRLMEKWKFHPGDLDRIVLHHELHYHIGGSPQLKRSSLVVTGEGGEYTAMAKTVGLPMGIAAKLLLTGKLKITGVQMPVMPELYVPVLRELESLGIRFVES